MKYSIKKQMLSLFIGMLGFILVAVFIANGNFLEKYYIHNKEQVLTQIYTTLDTLLSEDEKIDSEKLNEALRADSREKQCGIDCYGCFRTADPDAYGY